MIKTKKERLLASTLLVAGAALTLAPAAAAQTQTVPAPAPQAAADDTDDEEIVVTGSIIRGNANSVSPLGVLSADDLDNRGQTTIAETLQTISGNAGGSLPNSFTANGAFAAGAAGVSLRGLLTSNTLVLVDGLRPAYYPLADDATRNFVDTNTIAQGIVERVEVLKDGASSTYGSDAIAGVINIITRREFQGLEAEFAQGFAEAGGADQTYASAMWGHGDLGADGFNFYVAAEFQRDDQLMNHERGYPFNTQDQSAICGESNGLGAIPAGDLVCDRNFIANGFQYDGSYLGFGQTNNAVVRRRNAANTAFAAGAASNYTLLNPSCDTGDGDSQGDRNLAVTIPAASHGVIAGMIGDVNLCQQDNIARYGVISPENERLSFSGRMTFRVNDGVEAYLQGNYYQNDVYYTGTPSLLRAVTTPAATGITVSSANLALPAYVCPAGSFTYVCTAGDAGAALNPNNPFAASGDQALIYYRFGDIERYNRQYSQSFRAAGGFSGDFSMMGGDWDFNVDASAMQTNLEVTQAGYLYVPNLYAAVRRGTYNFVNPQTNSDAVRDFISPTNYQDSVSKMLILQGNVSTELFDLPGGPAVLGVLGSIRYESLDNPSANPDSNGPEQRYFTINPFGASGSRDVESVAFELGLPVVDMLDISVSGRYDTYSSGQSNFSPKVGVRFSPFEFLTFRATASEGFRVPSFAESFADPSTGFITVTADPTWCAANHGGVGDPYCANYGLGLTSVASADLQPETSRNYNIGFIVRPFDNWSFSADYYKIEQEDVIGGADFNQAVDAYYAGDPIPSGFTIVPDVPNPAFPLAPPRILFVQYGLENLGTRETDGWDFQVQGSFDLGAVEWTTHGEATYLNSLTQQFPGGAEQEYAGTLGPYVITAASGTPQWRLNWTNTFVAGPATFAVTAYWTEGYLSVAEDNAGDSGDETCLSGVAGGTPHAYLDGTTPVVCEVDDSFYVDLHGSYDFTDHLTLYLDVSNVLDEDPAHDPTTYGAWQYNPAWGTPGILGRYFTIGARARF